MKYFVYILKCSDNTLYTGITNDLINRLKTHNEGKASKYTRGRTPVCYSYIEQISNVGSALKRERSIKKLPKVKKLELIESNKNQIRTLYKEGLESI